ncbi:GNAT family N-acetyltransferase [Psychromonas sp. 14N.309.X.WAT.B.A12]|uniref:GNAT family N-acetyltransferase n=1 Tax=unclassified Psychromonas TaxID=2614957 RepID=UPI0025B1A30F|nr:GNAT family N-acetyltransferase [Psychromonas sp. 14N.309.X.WAT.B.A12]MDN2662402.1 GNAT family N-acetyltransferase [Psychromonas sp. 14N.309.X.WAT.B.A12]
MRIIEIDWQQTIAIRHQVLWPDKKPEFCIVEGDEQALHYAVELNGQLICVASIYRDHDCVRLRKFATLVDYQGKGAGSLMLRFIINALKEAGTSYFWFDARESALAFYQGFGFEVEGELFYKSDVAYYKMARHL